MDRLPEATVSYWVDSTETPDLPRPPALAGVDVDVAVLGAGIAGLTTAYQLTQAGRSVAVIEADRIAAGVSGHTTAKITSQHNLIYVDLAGRFGPDKAALYGHSQQAALDWIATQVRELKIDCDFRRRDAHVYAEDPSYRPKLRKEAQTAAELGLPAGYTEDVDLPYPVAGAVRFTGQAQFHPRRYLLALARHIVEAGGLIVEGVRARGLGTLDESVVQTTAGELRARDVVVTTHYPAFDRGFFFPRLSPKRSLLMAAPAPSVPGAMYIAADTGHSIRTTPGPDGKELLIIGGEGYPAGETSEVEVRFRRLAAWGQERFGMEHVAYRWATQDNTSVDRLPYIGRYHPLARHLWVATGFGLWGMTNGTLSGMLLADLITGVDNPWARLYEPSRLTVRQSAGGLTKLGVKTSRHYAVDYPRAFAPGDKIAGLEPGQATVTHAGLQPVAAYRDLDGRLSAVSAVCTHLGCLVAFNDAEKSWDCPCHGSRFAIDGSVRHGPATRPLKTVDLDDPGAEYDTSRSVAGL